ncbi:PEP-CTERM sorting domain-containing protein [Altererythrobacter aquiaggeris]|uniref:PEP-CTERM sorting domain-containing protein n=1 Tax=Aestuarierythrobacter aquiaggeris TaxID=1898396 RepID=UPI00301815A9
MTIGATLSAVLTRVPEFAAVQIPEPSNLALFAIGVAGVLAGRKLARKPGEADKLK